MDHIEPPLSSKPTRHKQVQPIDFRKRIAGLLRVIGVPLLFSIIYPLFIYYGLRALGIESFAALMIGALPMVGFQLYQFIRKGRIDRLGIFLLLVLGFSVVMAFITGSARFMLAKAGFLTALIGIGFLISVFFKKPVIYTMVVYLLKHMDVSPEHMEFLWAEVPKFRRVWKVSTIVWGVGTLFNAMVVLVMAYSLPIDLVPALSTVIHLIVFIILQVATNIYYNKQGIWKLVFYPEIMESQEQSQYSGS